MCDFHQRSPSAHALVAPVIPVTQYQYQLSLKNSFRHVAGILVRQMLPQSQEFLLVGCRYSCRLIQSKFLHEKILLPFSLSVMVDLADQFTGMKLSIESGLFLCNQISYYNNRLIHYSSISQGWLKNTILYHTIPYHTIAYHASFGSHFSLREEIHDYGIRIKTTKS